MKKVNEVRHLLYIPIIFRHQYYRILNIKFFNKLKSEKKPQIIEFEKLREVYLEKYKSVSKYPLRKYVTDTWKDFNKMMESVLLPQPRLNFLENPFIIFSMFMTKGGDLMKTQVKYIEKKFGKNLLKSVLKEDVIGTPIIMDRKYLSSHNKINMLYHLARYKEKTGIDPASFSSIVEWGGGYGGLASILIRMRKKPFTYICIDTPLIITLQWLYLASIFGKKSVNFISKPSMKIVKNKINFVPVSLIEKIKITGDMFISTWALSESSKYSHELVNRKKWFGAKHLLLGFQKNASAFEGPERIGKYAKKIGAEIEPVGLYPDNYYAFK